MPDEPQVNPVAMSAGLPRTVLPPADPDAEARLADALHAPAGAAQGGGVRGAGGRTRASSTAGRRSATRAATRSSATRPTASATTGGSTPCAPTGGAGRATCAGRRRPTAGSSARSPGSARWRRRSARTTRPSGSRSFLAQLDPRPPARTVDARRPAPSLCGGASRPDGHRQGVVEVDGVAMAERVARALEAAGCAAVRFVGGDAPAAGARSGGPCSPTRYPGGGRLGGVITALRATRSPPWWSPSATWPMLDADTVRRGRRATASADLAVAVAHTDRLEPLLACVAAGGARCARGAVRRRRAGPAPGARGRSATSPSRSPPAACATSTRRPTCPSG